VARALEYGPGADPFHARIGLVERAGVVLLAALLAVACSDEQGAATAASAGSTASSGGAGAAGGGGAAGSGGGTGGAIACAPAPPIERVAASTQKVCQVVGDFDRQLGQPTPNLTDTTYGLWGTDLGASFEHDGKLWVLFGDSIPTGPGTDNPDCGDAIAVSEDASGADCLDLAFLTGPGGVFRSPTVPGWDAGCFNVPLDGVSRGSSMFVWFSAGTMTRSLLARSDDGAGSFAFVRDVSDLHFVNVSAEVVGPTAGLPIDGDAVLSFGSGEYRMSSVYLAASPLGAIEDGGATRYFTGMDGCTPVWGSSESDAVPLFDQPCVGELSVEHVPELDAWVAFYNCAEPRGINARFAAQPWGPWSEPLLVLEPWADGAYCQFMHTSWEFQMCDSVHDPGRENEWGGEYGPYLVRRLTEGGDGHATLYFMLSTWNPYSTMLLRTELARTR
jgi:uncharacterized protein DUF4185